MVTLMNVREFEALALRDGGRSARLCARSYLLGLGPVAEEVPELQAWAYPAAACNTCAGWTAMGGMSQHAAGPEGCRCHVVPTLSRVAGGESSRG